MNSVLLRCRFSLSDFATDALFLVTDAVSDYCQFTWHVCHNWQYSLKQHENHSKKTKSKCWETFRDLIDDDGNLLWGVACCYLRQWGYVFNACLRVCVTSITQKRMEGFGWHFARCYHLGQGRCVLPPVMETHCMPCWYLYHPTLWVRCWREYIFSTSSTNNVSVEVPTMRQHEINRKIIAFLIPLTRSDEQRFTSMQILTVRFCHWCFVSSDRRCQWLLPVYLTRVSQLTV